MTIDELKQTIEQRTGVPASFLTGETAEENIAQAKALLAYKRESQTQTQPKSNAQKFAEWLGAQAGAEPQDEASAALADVEEAARAEAGGYPLMNDGGEVTGLPDARPAREQFSDWWGQQTAFNPFKDTNGWQGF